MDNLKQIKKNHEDYKATDSIKEKLTFAAKNCILQMRNCNNAFTQISMMAKSAGYKVNRKTGELEKII